MTRENDNIQNRRLQALLERVRDGHLDDLSPNDVTDIETYLNVSPDAAAQLASAPAAPTQQIDADLTMPTADAWEQVWSNIEAATAPAQHQRRPAPSPAQPHRRPRIIRLWQGLSAAAACLLAAVAWQIGGEQSSAGNWTIQLSGDVEIHELEVYDDESVFVAYSESGDGSAIIWVYDDDEDSEGV